MIERVFLVLSEASVVATLLLTLIEVISRRVFSFSFQLNEEIGGYLLVSMFFFSLSACQGTDAYHRVEIVQSRLSPRWRLVTRVVFEIMNLIACLILLWFVARFERLSWIHGDTSMSLLAIPLWIPRATMPIGLLVLCYAIICTIVRQCRDFAILARTGKAS